MVRRIPESQTEGGELRTQVSQHRKIIRQLLRASPLMVAAVAAALYAIFGTQIPNYPDSDTKANALYAQKNPSPKNPPEEAKPKKPSEPPGESQKPPAKAKQPKDTEDPPPSCDEEDDSDGSTECRTV